jgi:hypothetical protein
MPGAVSDSSPLIHLAATGRLELLRHYFGEVIIPPAVWHEVVEQGGGREGVAEIVAAHDAGWIRIVPPHDRLRIRELEQDLHSGEAESIALALELQPDVLLLDETEARRIAQAGNIPVTGCIGVLLRAKSDKKIRSLRAELDRLQRKGNFWISKPLYRQILISAGEKERR